MWEKPTIAKRPVTKSKTVREKSMGKKTTNASTLVREKSMVKKRPVTATSKTTKTKGLTPIQTLLEKQSGLRSKGGKGIGTRHYTTVKKIEKQCLRLLVGG